MPDHRRKQIRDAVVLALTGLTTTGSRVYAGRTRRLASAHDPSLLVYTHGETAERDAVDNRGVIMARSLTVAVEGRVSLAGVAAPDDTLDQIAAEVEAVMADLDFRLMGLSRPVQFVDTAVEADGENERQIGGIRLQYRVTYRTLMHQPDAAV